MDNKKQTQVEKYGGLKILMELEGDGYFFYGYGLPSEFKNEEDLSTAFSEAEKAIDKFKTIVEQKIIENDGEPEDWVA